MHRVLFFLLMLIFFSPITARAQQVQAVVKEVSGKVEVKPPGQDWQPVVVNMPVSTGATVSTGFSSRLVLALGQTQITVWPLTRMLLRELIKKDATNSTSLSLRVGKLNAVVKTASGERSDFTVRGPAATAAVRGTEFDFDANLDDETTAHTGSVSVIAGLTGHEWTLYPGEILQTNGIRFTYVLPSGGPPQGDLLTTALTDQGGFVPYTSNGWLGWNRLPTSTSPSATITLTVN